MIDQNKVQMIKQITTQPKPKVRSKETQMALEHSDILDSLLTEDIKSLGKEDFQLIEKVMVDFVMSQIQNNVKSKVVSVYVSPFINRNLTSPFTKKLLNKALADKKQHNENDTLRYEKIKNQKNKTEGDLAFMKEYENPEVSKQLNACCRYRSADLSSRYNDIMIDEESGNSTD